MQQVDLILASLKKLGFEITPSAKPILCLKGTDKECEKFKFQVKHPEGFSGQLWLDAAKWQPPAPPVVSKGVLPPEAEWVLAGDEVVAAKPGREYATGTQWADAEGEWHILEVKAKSAPTKPAAPKKPAPPAPKK
jgi:hypothetical protein